MARRPSDRTDLFLAPVILELDRRLQVLGEVGERELDRIVGTAANVDTAVLAVREQALLHTVTQAIDLHGGEASWDERGLRVSHGDHSVVLGLPAVIAAYRASAAE